MAPRAHRLPRLAAVGGHRALDASRACTAWRPRTSRSARRSRRSWASSRCRCPPARASWRRRRTSRRSCSRCSPRSRAACRSTWCRSTGWPTRSTARRWWRSARCSRADGRFADLDAIADAGVARDSSTPRRRAAGCRSTPRGSTTSRAGPTSGCSGRGAARSCRSGRRRPSV